MDNVRSEIEEIVNRETRAWDTQDVDLLMTVDDYAHRRLGLRIEGLVRETEVAFRRIVEILGRHMTRRGSGHR